MGIRIPRITLKADYGEESAFGELSLLSVGYGLRQAWIYAAMFGTSTIFGVPILSGQISGHSLSLTFFVSILVFGICLLIASITDQKLLRFYVSRKVLAFASVITCLGTALLLLPFESFEVALTIEIISGVITGVGTALLILFWGTAFSRCDGSSIILNTAVAIVVGVAVYAAIIQHLPFPIAGILTALLPIGELFILLKKTPAPFSERNELPIFNPLPVKRGRFFFKFGLPVFIFGIALGILRHTSIQTIAPAATAGDQVLMLLAAGCATILILITLLALGGSGRWSRLFRPLIPFIAVAVFFLPYSQAGDLTFSSFVLLIGYMCFEALMWIFFGELAQRFRLSPVFVFGAGRGLLALSSLVGSLLPVYGEQWIASLPFGESGITILILLVMVVAYALLPQEKEIEAIVVPCPLVAAFPRAEDERIKKNLPKMVEVTSSEEGIKQDASASRGGHITQADTRSSRDEQAPQQQAEDNAKSGRFKTRCEAIANTYLLSRRETEVMFFLSKGHNSAYIQEKLFISEGTAKTHIRHIYRKLDIHNQQELMRMVESVELDS